jgi:2-keto-3-deoxy-L-rhamnonate aldolase RhmA
VRSNRLRERLHGSDDLLVGIFITLPSSALVEMAAIAGFDFVIVDMEHTNLTELDVEDMARAGGAAGISVMVRPRDKEPETIIRIMETGVDGLLIPQIDDAEQAQRAVSAAYYAPRGTRGVSSLSRAANYGFGGEQPDPVCAVQIESKASVDAIEGILDVPMIDVAFVGPSDLRNSLIAHAGNADGVDDAVRSAVETTTAAIAARDLPFLGVPAPHPAMKWDRDRCVERGARFATLGADVSILAGGMKGAVAPFRS